MSGTSVQTQRITKPISTTTSTPASLRASLPKLSYHILIGSHEPTGRSPYPRSNTGNPNTSPQSATDRDSSWLAVWSINKKNGSSSLGKRNTLINEFGVPNPEFSRDNGHRNTSSSSTQPSKPGILIQLSY
ncbi:expressed protein [Phakopsora pachyrhizi]|uniref:Expressed protein n=1 Tax=Phakopsora pachyrhizi TaxID=170000 RepID=A0AAV0AH73_PHAPC|nr:expressed protein [Phakopsora pachyrhizi]